MNEGIRFSYYITKSKKRSVKDINQLECEYAGYEVRAQLSMLDFLIAKDRNRLIEVTCHMKGFDTIIKIDIDSSTDLDEELETGRYHTLNWTKLFDNILEFSNRVEPKESDDRIVKMFFQFNNMYVAF